MPEWTCSIRSSPVPAGGSARSAPRLRLRYLRVGGSLATGRPLPRPVVDRFDLHTAFLGHAPLGGQVLQRVDRGAPHVVRVGRAQALRENIPHARALQDRAHRAARDHPGSRGGGLEEDAARAVVPHDLVRARAAGQRNLHHASARGLDGLAHCLAHFVGLAGGDPHPSLPVADRDERVEPEPSAPLHDLGDAVDRDHVFEQAVAFALTLTPIAALAAPAAAAAAPPAAPAAPATPATPATPTTPAASAASAASAARPFLHRRFATRMRRLGLLTHARCAGCGDRGRGRGRDFTLLIYRHQNSNPPLRAPSARALTRPWYW